MGDDLLNNLDAALGGAYVLERELGGGWMSRVFLAQDRTLGRQIVVKVLSPDLLAGVNRERFEREVQLTARLQHPHIVPILSSGEVDGIPYYTMPFEEGESLRVRLARSGALPVSEAASILRDVARAFEFAHERASFTATSSPRTFSLSAVRRQSRTSVSPKRSRRHEQKTGPARALQLIRPAQEIVGESELLLVAEGMIYWQYVNVGLRPATTYDEYLQRGEACATRIFELNPESSKGYALRGSIRNNRGDPAASMHDFKRALALDPNDAECLLWLGYAYAVAGQISVAAAFADRLLHVDPLTSINVVMRGMVAMFDGRYEDALQWSQRSVEIDPDNPTNRTMHAHMLAANQRRSEAITILEAVAHNTPEMGWAKLANAMASALRGDRDGVLRILTPELRAMAWWDDLFCWWTANCFALVGETDASLDFLERRGKCSTRDARAKRATQSPRSHIGNR